MSEAQTVNACPFQAHEEFMDEQIFAPLIKYAKARGVPTAEVVACTLYYMAIELAISGVTEDLLHAIATLGAEAAEELR